MSQERFSISGTSLPNCLSCNSIISDPSYLLKPVCGHSFHKACFHKYIKTNPNCPVCDNKLVVSTPSTVVTRSQSQRAINFEANRSANPSSPPVTGQSGEANLLNVAMSSSSPQDQRDHIQTLVSAAVEAQQANIINSLSLTLTRLIESNLAEGFRRINIPNNFMENRPEPRIIDQNPSMQSVEAVEQQTLEQLLGLPNNNRQNIGTGTQNLNLSGSNNHHISESSFRPDKIGHIIYNWKLRFSGDSRGISVDNFLYRVEALTHQTLNGNFNLLCDHISTLFDAKANDWFWRYHRSVNRVINWPNLCAALKKQYKDSRTDVDIREMIRDRKQKMGESFDEFYEAVVNISDRLTEPLSENILVEILRRNLLPEIQHEILNLTIKSVSDLRDVCRRREFFLQDVSRKQTFPKPFVRKQVHEIEDDMVESTDVEEVSANSLICWNFQKSCQRYHDCLEDRRVFCYGCGIPNVYKPKCTKCSQSKNFRSSALKSAHKLTNSTSTNTD